MAEHGDQSTPGPEGIHARGGSAGNRGSRKPLSKDRGGGHFALNRMVDGSALK